MLLNTQKPPRCAAHVWRALGTRCSSQPGRGASLTLLFVLGFFSQGNLGIKIHLQKRLESLSVLLAFAWVGFSPLRDEARPRDVVSSVLVTPCLSLRSAWGGSERSCSGG